MSARSALARLVDGVTARAFAWWDGFKQRNPRQAETLAPILRELWVLAVRRRPSMAAMRSDQGPGHGPAWREVRAGVPSAGIAHGQATQNHHIEDRVNLVAIGVEYVFAVPDTGVFIVGWMFDPLERVSTITVTAGDDRAVLSPNDMVRIPRADVTQAYESWTRKKDTQKNGFAALVRFDGVADDVLVTSLHVDFADDGETTWSLSPRPIIRDPASPLAVIRDVLTLVPPRDPSVLDRHVGPAVDALWATREHSDRVVDIGGPPSEPAVSLVVPVYGRYDLIEYQMALFADDADVLAAELIYVIDDPGIVDDVVRLCRDIHPIFGVSCRLVLCEKNNGFAGATNIGARLARGRMVLLLNSDVMPARPGWLSALLEAYEQLPEPGALGPRLLFPDGSVQHAGMAFVQEPWFPGVWLNDHPGKGLPPGEPTDHEVTRQPAITAACMLVPAALYWEVGGLDEGYPVGDFEDSDFCLKLAERGHGSFIAPWVELYHLERQSLAFAGEPDWRQALTLYNAWRHTRRWGDVIAHADRAVEDVPTELTHV